MKFVSTRGECPPADFHTAFMQGYAPDGGMYLPEEWPVLPYKQWSSRTYPQIVAELCKLFIDEPDMPIDDFCAEVYDPKNWSHPQIAPVVTLQDGLHVQELFHGSTWAFKDYSLALLGKIMNWYLERTKQRRIVLIATSGDTGSAAMAGVAGQARVDMVVLMPAAHRISRIQRLQMSTQREENLHLFEADCSSDDFDQQMVMPIFADQQFCVKHNIGTLNSPNIGRVLVQMAHWLYAHLLYPHATFAVPTGSAGNVTAAAMLQQMGVPLKVVICTNMNNVLHKMIQTGYLESEPVRRSMACAIDIAVPYNVERLIWIYSDKDSVLTARLIRQFYTTGKCQLPDHIHKKMCTLIVDSVSVSEQQISESMCTTQAQLQYGACPHTATALHLAFTQPQLRPIICVATASPQKFYDVYDNMPQLQAPPKSHQLVALEKTKEQPPILLLPAQRNDWANVIRRKIEAIHELRVHS